MDNKVYLSRVLCMDNFKKIVATLVWVTYISSICILMVPFLLGATFFALVAWAEGHIND